MAPGEHDEEMRAMDLKLERRRRAILFADERTGDNGGGPLLVRTSRASTTAEGWPLANETR